MLRQNQTALAANGFLYPIRRRGEHRLMAMDLREIPWGGKHDPRSQGMWDQFADRARAWGGHTVILSNELLGGATPEQTRRAVESLQPAEVHVVFTTRDLARQLPSDWQEQIKHQHTVPLQQFTGDLVRLEMDAPRPFGHMFWGLHDPLRVLGNWIAAVPAERIHVVTVPQPGAAKDTLWTRFASVVGLDPEAYDTEVTAKNTSMGAAETELVRRVNGRLGNRLRRHYDPLVRIYLAESVLAARKDSARIELPAEHHVWAAQRSKHIVESLHDAGYQVTGDLEELQPTAVTTESELPEDKDSAELLDASIDCIVNLLERVRDLRERAERMGQGDHAQLADRAARAEQELAELRAATSKPVTFAATALADRYPLVRWPRSGYRGLRQKLRWHKYSQR